MVVLMSSAVTSLDLGSIPGNETAVLIRHKRFFVPLVSGWTFTFRPTLIVPIATPFNSVFTQLFYLMPITVKMDNLLSVNRRSLDVRQNERVTFLQTLEDLVERIDQDRKGRPCMLRTICEVAASPEVGGVFNLLLTPQDDADVLMKRSGFHQSSEYLAAQQAGKVRRDCSGYERTCPKSFFEFDDEAETAGGNFYHEIRGPQFEAQFQSHY